jgi:hypothetical protein
MRAGTAVLAISGAVEERKSHEAMSAVRSSMDPNEAAKAQKKFMASPHVGVGDRFKRRLAERNLALRARVEANDVDDLPEMIERYIADKLDDHSQIGPVTSARNGTDFASLASSRLEIETERPVPALWLDAAQRGRFLFFDSARTQPSANMMRRVELPGLSRSSNAQPTWREPWNTGFSKVASLKIDDRVEDDRPIGVYRNSAFVLTVNLAMVDATATMGQAGTHKRRLAIPIQIGERSCLIRRIAFRTSVLIRKFERFGFRRSLGLRDRNA